MKALNRQSLFDIAVQECGSVEAAFGLAILNNLSISDELTPNNELKPVGVTNQKIVDHFKVNEIRPATAITDNEATQTISDEGIEFWAIETDFIIS